MAWVLGGIGWMDRWMGAWLDAWLDGWMDGWMDGFSGRRAGGRTPPLERVIMPTLHIRNQAKTNDSCASTMQSLSHFYDLLSKLLRFSIKCHLSICRTYYHTKILFTLSDMTTL